MTEIKNKILESGILIIDLQDFTIKSEIIIIDIKNFLHNEFILQEKSFRAAISNLDTSKFKNKIVAIHCSSDAIIPLWAYMAITAKISSITTDIYQGSKNDVEKIVLLKKLEQINLDQYENQKVMIKGCGQINNPELAFTIITKRLLPIVKSLMYGEPCSAVPIFKRKH